MRKNIVIWSDVVIFEDGSFVLEKAPVEIVHDYRDDFNKHYFSAEEELAEYFGAKKVIYDCDKFVEFIKKKYNRPFALFLLDTTPVSDNLLARMKKLIELSKCGGYINGIQF